MKQKQIGSMAEKIKVKPYNELKHDFKEIEVATKSWNLETRRLVNKYVVEAGKNNGTTEFDAYCEIIKNTTTLTDEEIFNMSDQEIQAIGIKVIQEFSKKK